MLPVSLLCFWSYVVAVKTVGCIGDSITQGGCKYGRNETYTAQLQVLLGNAYNVHNFGVSGMTMLTDGLCGASKPQIVR
jgi:acyl-CoA thioesterase-1